MSENETVADIVSEMRGNEFDDQHLNADGIIGVRRIAKGWANRIESAWKRDIERERQKRDEAYEYAEDVAWNCGGNAAAMREALENSNGLLEELAAIGEWGESAREQIAENNAALSAPPRNCDRFNSGNPAKDAEDAYDEWQRYCDCSPIPQACKVESSFRQWLLRRCRGAEGGKRSEEKCIS